MRVETLHFQLWMQECSDIPCSQTHAAAPTAINCAFVMVRLEALKSNTFCG